MSSAHDREPKSWVESANEAGADFPLANLPYGVFRRRGGDAPARVGVAIGDSILDVTAAGSAGLIPHSAAAAACEGSTLNPLMLLTSAARRELRATLTELLQEGSRMASKSRARDLLVPIKDADLHLPVAIGDYTDFYASIHHATNVGRMLRPDNPLLPNYKYIPIGYHGRASSIVVSGTPVRRPLGQMRAPDAPGPTFGPSRMLDYESELGLFVGRGNTLGSVLPLADAEDHVFGYCLVNDWSARDIQTWEYQPLGPFLAKNFATTISPWVVTSEAIEPYRIPAFARREGDPPPLDYLMTEQNERSGGIDATLEVHLSSASMRQKAIAPVLLSRAPFSHMYWTMAQLVAHHASNGCNLRTGDLIASGTVSGPTLDSLGCLLELTRRGANPVTLPTGETRTFLEDGDEVTMRGRLGSGGRPTIGFGECRGVILPAIA
ncbi:MAG TPA: fumarylacetoacetase [Gemmatimonadaceae bacterium]